MSTGGKQRFPWLSHPLFWIGWIAGGMTSVFVLGVALAVVSHGRWPGSDWLINIGYAVATIPTIHAFYILNRRAHRRNSEMLADARRRAEEDDHER